MDLDGPVENEARGVQGLVLRPPREHLGYPDETVNFEQPVREWVGEFTAPQRRF